MLDGALFDPKVTILRWTVTHHGIRWRKRFRTPAAAWRALIGSGHWLLMDGDWHRKQQRYSDRGYDVVPSAWRTSDA